MKPVSFFEGTGVALVASLAGSVIFIGLASLFGAGGLLRLLVTGLAFAYVVYLLARSPHRVGRISTLVIWLCISAVGWLFVPSAFAYLALQLGLIWLVRALYYYHSVLSALLDLGLVGMSLLAAIWAWSNTHSLFLSLWCFFLVQALFVYIPRQLSGRKSTAHVQTDSDHFERAHRAAQAAVRKLTSI